MPEKQIFVDPVVTDAGLRTLRKVLMRLRKSNQGGFRSYNGNKQWAFTSIALLVSAQELNTLLKLAGIVPDKIESLGECKDCNHSKNGREQGYNKKECTTCLRPKMSNWTPKI